MKKPYYDLIAQSTREVFEVMSFMDVIPEEPIAENCEIDGIGATASVCLAGEISGMLALYCSRTFASECFARISGTDEPATTAQIADTVGELANMIAGTFKRLLSMHIDLFYLSLPVVFLSHEGHRVFCAGAKDDFPRLLVPFVVEQDEKFYVEILYHRR